MDLPRLLLPKLSNFGVGTFDFSPRDILRLEKASETKTHEFPKQNDVEKT